MCIVWNLEPLASGGQPGHKLIPHIICQFLYAWEKSLNEDLFYKGSSANLPRLHTCEIKPRSGIKVNLSRHNSNNTEVYGRVLLLSQDCSTLPLISTLYCWVLIKEVSSTYFKVFDMTRPGIESRSPGPLANNLPTRPMSRSLIDNHTPNNSL